MSDTTTPPKKRLSFTSYIVIGLLLGLLCGLFFGDYVVWIKWIGDVYVGLLQMTVLPYVAISLIVNVGRLSLAEGYRLLRVGVGLILVLWLIGLLAFWLMTMAFPVWETGSFFSSRFTEEPPPTNWLDLFVPSNPFRSLAESSIPAVVVFSIGLGIALMTLPNKEAMLNPLNVAVDALAKLNKLVVQLTPIGMFGIVAYTAGTIDFEQFILIQGYLLTYGAAAVILVFVLLPALIAAVTPFSFAEVARAARDPLIAAFVIGNSFVVLPMVIEAVNKLFHRRGIGADDDDSAAEYLVPMAYPFPDIGRIVGLVFIPFAAWFYGTSIDPNSYAGLLGVGLLGSFGKPVITIPLLLSIAELPSDIFNLFIASGVVAARFGDLMKTMHLVSFAVVATCIFNGMFRIDWTRLLLGSGASLLVFLLVVFSIRTYLDVNFKNRYSKEQLITERDMAFPKDSRIAKITATTLTRSSRNPDAIGDGQTRVARIKDRGKIRIGFDSDRMPFCYFRAGDQPKLVGFDIEMAYHLADDLQVDIEFVPIDPNYLNEQLQNDHFDIAMSALEGTVKQAALLPAVEPYMDTTLAIVVPDHQKGNFRSTEEIFAIEDLTLAVIKGGFFAERAPKVLPETVQIVELQSASEFFENQTDDIHGLVTSAESGSAWTLRQPNFSVANPLKGRIRVPLYYLTASDPDFETFLQNWLTLQRADGTYDELYEYWILGLDKEVQRRRWCVIRDVLGWVD